MRTLLTIFSNILSGLPLSLFTRLKSIQSTTSIDAGLPCPSRRNPSDHFLLCINLDFDLVTSALARAQLDLFWILEPFYFNSLFFLNDNASKCEFQYPDWQLSSSNSALGAKKAEIRETLIRSYEGSRLMINARRRIQQLKANVTIS